MSKGLLSNAGTFSLTYNLPYWFYKFIKAHPMKELSQAAKIRLAMIEFYYQIKDASIVCKIFNISRKTFYKWLRRYKQSDKKLSSFENYIKISLTKRKTTLDFNTELKIKHLREKYIRLGKIKLQRLFKKEYGEYVSQSHIAYVIKKYNLFYDPVLAKKIRSKKNKLRGTKKN